MKSKEERREIVKTALKIQKGLRPHLTIPELAELHGITRSAVYNYLSWVTKDPWARLDKAQEEVDFMLDVLELMGYDVDEWLEGNS